MPTVYTKRFVDVTEAELAEMTMEEAQGTLTDRQILFCNTYMKSYNIKSAAIKAGYKPTAAAMAGYKLRQDPRAQKYLAWLKLQMAHECQVDAMAIIDQYIRIAFSDMTDFVDIKNNRIKLKDGELIDGQLVHKVSNGLNGISVELVDKKFALDKLDRFFDIMPKDWKQLLEERKLELLERKLDFDIMKAGGNDDDTQDDGFIEALKDMTKSIWEGEEEDAIEEPDSDEDM